MVSDEFRSIFLGISMPLHDNLIVDTIHSCIEPLEAVVFFIVRYIFVAPIFFIYLYFYCFSTKY